MPETLPGRTKPDTSWGGEWHTIERQEYHRIIANVGGLNALSVAASATHPHGEDYVYTAWALKGSGVPLVASELEDCGPYEGKRPEECGGTHTFWRFTPWPLYHCSSPYCGERERREPPQCRASLVHCECGEVMREVTDA